MIEKWFNVIYAYNYSTIARRYGKNPHGAEAPWGIQGFCFLGGSLKPDNNLHNPSVLQIVTESKLMLKTQLTGTC